MNNGLPGGWVITGSVEPVYDIPYFELILRCATKEIAEKYANSIVLNEKIVNRITAKEIIRYRQDIINQDEFDKLKKHEYRKESIHDETCLECGFPERFHENTVQTNDSTEEK